MLRLAGIEFQPDVGERPAYTFKSRFHKLAGFGVGQFRYHVAGLSVWGGHYGNGEDGGGFGVEAVLAAVMVDMAAAAERETVCGVVDKVGTLMDGYEVMDGEDCDVKSTATVGAYGLLTENPAAE